VNGGLARSAGRRVKPSAGASGETMVASRPHRCKHGRGPAQDPGWREIVIQRFSRRHKRCEGRGTGATRPPDPTKGPCRWKASRIITRRRLSRDGVNDGLGGFRHLPTRTKPSKRRTCGQASSARESDARRGDEPRVATGVSEARSRRPPREQHARARSVGREASGDEVSVRRRSAEAVSGVVKRPVPR
jgi:hypothetical protein